MKKIFAIMLSCICFSLQLCAFAEVQAENPAEGAVIEELSGEQATVTEENEKEAADDKETEDEKDTDAITVIVNGEKLVADVEPQLVNDRTMLPMRAIFESLGARVTWVAEQQTIFAVAGERLMVMQIGLDVMSVQKVSDNSYEAITLDAPPYIYKDRTLVPVRAVAEAMEATVEWDAETRTVTINQ